MPATCSLVILDFLQTNMPLAIYILKISMVTTTGAAATATTLKAATTTTAKATAGTAQECY
jgi:hypothetical protein